MKKTENYENMTMAEIRELLNEKVSDYNLSTNSETRIDLAVEHNALVQKYNELSLLHMYSECLKAENPIIAFGKAYYYDTISVKDAPHSEVIDGKKKTTVTRSIIDGNKKLNLIKFIEWTEECNKGVAVDKSWRKYVAAARTVVENEWKKFFAAKGDTKAMSIGKTKKALQEMFDALVFIESETGKNAVIANGNTAKWVLGFANTRKDSKADGIVKITGTILAKQTWATLIMDILHMTVEKKEYEILIGHEEEDVQPEETEEEETK